eukprot:TRINITY_DN2300_c0_g1_i3.p1 TRINITY_DN2300_c0_g1~~TRINITY_DN2300_c0_g1_i3.p1  ORF type:complete len:196 (+),score=37.28 TRINITY_DN2300_c0_g1_i3:166-753(+)
MMCRGPLFKGRILSSDAMQAVQSMKRAKGDVKKLDHVFETRVSRLLKVDLLALLKELRRQRECNLALRVFDTVRKESWYKPDIQLYISIISMLHENNFPESIELLYADLKEEYAEANTKDLTQLIMLFLRIRMPQKAMEIYDLMKHQRCQLEEYTFQVLIKGLRRLNEDELADAVTKDFQQYQDSLWNCTPLSVD